MLPGLTLQVRPGVTVSAAAQRGWMGSLANPFDLHMSPKLKAAGSHSTNIRAGNGHDAN